MLPLSRHEAFNKEKETLGEKRMIKQCINPSQFPIHKSMANIIEAAVERPFSRHKLFSANLSTEGLSDQLFVKYNFSEMLKIAHDFGMKEEEKDAMTW